jgi:two-component system cell cycle response regulator
MLGSDHPGPDLLLVLWSHDRELVGHTYALEPSVESMTIGRSATSDIVIPCKSVSRCHARFERRADGWWVLDDCSTSGTFVNDERVQGVLLRHGDKIRLGGTILKLTDAIPIVETTYSATSIDGLTQLHNRRHLFAEIERELQQRAEHPEHRLALVLLDIDRFQRVNHEHGHLVGDQVLRELASLLRAYVRPGEVLARYGGEEFVLLMPGSALEAAAARAEMIRAEIAAHEFVVEGHAISVTLSAGVVQPNEGIRTAVGLVHAADETLYAAKLGARG